MNRNTPWSASLLLLIVLMLLSTAFVLTDPDGFTDYDLIVLGLSWVVYGSLMSLINKKLANDL